MSSQTNELHVHPVDYESLVQKVAENVKMTVGRDNTSLAYDPKKVEFLEFCDALYSKEHNPRLVTVEKNLHSCITQLIEEKKMEEVVILTKRRNNLI